MRKYVIVIPIGRNPTEVNNSFHSMEAPPPADGPPSDVYAKRNNILKKMSQDITRNTAYDTYFNDEEEATSILDHPVFVTYDLSISFRRICIVRRFHIVFSCFLHSWHLFLLHNLI